MANNDQEILDHDLARDSELGRSTETLDPKITQLITRLTSLQNCIKDNTKSFNESQKLLYQQEGAVKETLNENLRLQGMIAARSSKTFKKEETGQDFRQKRQNWMHERKESCKKDRDDGKKSLIECIKEVDVSSREFSALILMKFHAFKVGKSLSLLLVDLVSMISGKEEFEAKIEGLKSALKWASTEEEDSMVINKIVTVLEHVIVLNEPVKKNWAGMEQRELDESNQEKSSMKRSKIDDECDQFLKNVLPLLINKFFKLAADLESFMSHPQLPKAQNLTYMNLSTFECDLKKSEKKLKGLQRYIDILRGFFSLKLEDTDVKIILGVMGHVIAESWKFEAQFSCS